MGDTIVVVLGGVVFGFLSAALPLGPVTVLVVHRTLAGDPSGALRFGLGRVAPELLYCALATFGTVAVLDRFPALWTGIEVLAIVLSLAVGTWLLAAKAAPVSVDPATVGTRRNRWGFTAGLVVGTLNPQYLFSWSAIVAIAVSVGGLHPSMVDRLVFPFAAANGVTVGYIALVRFLRRHSARLQGPSIRRVLRGSGGLLIAFALWKAVALIS